MISSFLSFQVMVDGSVTTVVLQNLTPLTEYLVNVYAIASEQSSEPLKGTETTCKWILSSPVCLHLPPLRPLTSFCAQWIFHKTLVVPKCRH